MLEKHKKGFWVSLVGLMMAQSWKAFGTLVSFQALPTGWQNWFIIWKNFKYGLKSLNFLLGNQTKSYSDSIKTLGGADTVYGIIVLLNKSFFQVENWVSKQKTEFNSVFHIYFYCSNRVCLLFFLLFVSSLRNFPDGSGPVICYCNKMSLFNDNY